MKTQLTALFLVAAIAFTAAGEGDIHRFLNILVDPTDGEHTLSVRGTRVDGDGVDSIVFLASSRRVPRFAVRYFSKETDSKERVAARWRLWKIFQYTENTTTAGFDPQTDTIVEDRVIYLWNDTDDGNTLFQYYTYHVNETSGGDAKAIEFCNTKGIAGSPGRVTICCTITATRDENIDLTPDGIKWSIQVENLNWDGPIAIKTSFDTVSALSESEASDGDSNSIDLGSIDGASTSAEWIQTVSIEGTGCTSSADIIKSIVWSGQAASDSDADVPEEEDDTKLSLTAQVTYFSIVPTGNCQLDGFYWDPTLKASDAFFVQPAWTLLILLAYFFF